MPITIEAACDYVSCKKPPVAINAADRWPAHFIVIQIKQGAVGKQHATQILGFCSVDCLSNWAYEGIPKTVLAPR